MQTAVSTSALSRTVHLQSLSELTPQAMNTPLDKIIGSNTLRRVLLRSVLLVVALQLVLTALLAKFQLFAQVESLQVEINASLADTVGRSVQRALERPNTAVRAALDHWAVLGNAPSEVRQAMLQQLADTNNAAESVYLLDPRGKVLQIAYSSAVSGGGRGAVGSDRIGLDMSRSLLFGQIAGGEVGISPIFLSPITDQPTIAVAGRHSNGQVIVMEISLIRLTEGYNVANSDDGMQVLIVDKSGQIIADKDGAQAQQSGMLSIEALQSVNQNSANSITLRGQRWLASSHLISQGSLEWHVVVMRPLAQVYRPIVTIVALSLAGTLLLLLFTFLVLLLGTRKVASETEMLSANARALEAGITPGLQTLSVRELAEVDSSLRAMAKTLSQREKLLIETNEMLEERVLDRTRHLQRANTDLEAAMQKLEVTQAELVQSAKMSALGGMVAGVAHELNTPVGNARLAATTLVHTAESIRTMLHSGLVSRTELVRATDAFFDGASLIDGSLERAADIVRAFKQIAVDQTSNRRRKFSLRAVLHENEVLLSPRLKKSNITVLINAPEQLELDSFPGDLGQVLTNLIENAIVHGYQGAQSGCVEIAAELQGEAGVRIHVKDHGLGIAPEFLGRVFDPFYTTRLGQGGSGLGLSIAYNLVTSSLGGKISVTSETGHGSCFTLELPLRAPRSAAEIESDSTPFPLG
jgi:C4-dicarboxylate-specific signal transduction histidine kinase